MYVIRSALRASTGRPPARFIRGRRYPASPRLRPFHTSPALAQASNPPTAPESTPIGQNDNNEPSREKAAAEEQTDAAVATEDSDVLAQKLQRSREATRRYSAALRRQQRGKKLQGLPPVVIPDWFLKRRVIRPEDLPGDYRRSAGRAALTVSVSHADSNEEASCAIPVSSDVDVAQVLSRLVRGLWSKRLDSSEKRKIEKYLDERIAAVNSAEPSDPLEESTEVKTDIKSDQERDVSSPTDVQALDSPDLQKLAEAVPDLADNPSYADLSSSEKAELTKLTTRLNELLADTSLDNKQRTDAMKKQNMKIQRWGKKRERVKTRSASSSARLSPLVLAEIRATIAASLSTLRPLGGDSFPSAKTNLMLHSPIPEHEKLVDACIHRAAAELDSELIVLNAQDLAQLAGDYLGEGLEPSPRSVRSLGYETYRLSAELNGAMDELPDAAEEESEFPQPPSTDQPDPFRVRSFHIPLLALGPALRALTGNSKSLQPQALGQVQFESLANEANSENGRTQSQSELQLEDIKIAALLEALIDASLVKQSRGLLGLDGAPTLPGRLERLMKASKAPAFFDYSVDESPSLQLNSLLPVSVAPGIDVNVKVGSSKLQSSSPAKSKIIYVKDFKELNATHYGGRIIQKLEETVRKRRLAGESIMIVGSTCSRELTPELSASGVRGLQGEGESSFFRTIVTEAESGSEQSKIDELFAAGKNETGHSDLTPAQRSKFQRINLSHIREMLRSLDPAATTRITNMEQGQLPRAWVSILPDSHHKRVLTYDEVHRIALTALGLHITNSSGQAVSNKERAQMSWAHVALAIGLIRASDTIKYASFDRAGEMLRKTQNAFERREQKVETEYDEAKRQQNAKNMQRQRELQRISEKATKYEKRLMPGIADPDQIRTTFDQVHVPEETVDSLRTITSLALLRPDAFSYGILATEKISGALLYGPPGTGKTLLAKAVAKESGSTVLEVSGSQIMDKYVGEGEKNVAAIFSLARKLSPCIVFLDEADAVFASRDSPRDRTSHRDILNQFLKEWDGLNDLSIFVMVATNRPFDLDDAVIRRLPRRLLVDLPTQADRKEILRIHLRDEQLDESVDLDDLAARTPFYSGSDLKNVAVAAALACVKEENSRATLAASLQNSLAAIDEQGLDASSSTEETSNDAPHKSETAAEPISKAKTLHLVRGQTYNFPEKRVLRKAHFDQALHEISASISEAMSSLAAIKKFDEQYGDRKGKKRKKDFGFGVLTERNENAARVRI